MDRTQAPRPLLLISKSLLLQLLCFSVSLCLYTPAPPAPSQISPPSGILTELQSTSTPVYSPQSQCSLRVDPPELVVRFGDPVSVNCSNTQETILGWTGVPTTPSEAQVVSLLWTEDTMRTWSLEPVCFSLGYVESCHIVVPVTVYQPPKRVSLSFSNHSGPLLEGKLYCLQCEVEAGAPAQNMTVAFYRGFRELSVQSSSTQDKGPVNVSLCLDYSVSREDHGATFWCEARLELGPEGPQPPLVVRSANITTVVHFTEEQVEAPPTRSSREHHGRDTVSAQSQQSHRQHSEVQEPGGAGHAPDSSAIVLLALLILLV